MSGGFDVRCFTNGAGEDEKLLAAARHQLLEVDHYGKHVTFARRCETPLELSQLIATCDAIVAHRLHATIIAYSYRVPAIGLRWDDKVPAFFESVGRGAYVVEFDNDNVIQIAVSVSTAITEGIDAKVHARVLSETVRGIDRLVDAMEKHDRILCQHCDD